MHQNPLPVILIYIFLSSYRNGCNQNTINGKKKYGDINRIHNCVTNVMGSNLASKLETSS